MPQQLLFLELNEINFESVAFYCSRGRLPNLNRILQENGWTETTSEREYDLLEPWIQWVTAHTGLAFSEHGIFRLGDIVKSDLVQIWEQVEEKGLRVGAISPMNAKHRLRDPAFFVPDPWTDTHLTARPILRSLYGAIAQAVNDNAHSKLAASSVLSLLSGVLRYARVNNYMKYMQLVFGARSRPWRKAMFLDLLLTDVFIRETKATNPHFATLFVNAGAHIQHHYMFNAEAYEGTQRNPTWYAPQDADPVREVYELYDHIVGDVRTTFPNARLMLATGLHQVPHREVTYYWRLKEHAKFLKKLGIEFAKVEPRMSRDFNIEFTDSRSAELAADRLRSAVASDGLNLFEVDNRGKDLFVMLTFPRDIDEAFVFTIGGERFLGFREDVAFVALKNGEHSGIGYFLDTGVRREADTLHFPLSEMPQRIFSALELGHPQLRGV